MTDGEEQKKHNFQLYSEFEYKLDSQRRLAVPASWRASNPGGVFLLICARDRILQLYPEQAFTEFFAEKLERLKRGNADDMRKGRDFGRNIVSCICDGQGRIQLPKELLERADIASRVAMIGNGNFAQLMSAERRAAELEEARRNGTEDAYLDILDM